MKEHNEQNTLRAGALIVFRETRNQKKNEAYLFRHVSAWNLDYPVQRFSATFTKTTLLSEALPDINTAKLINFKLHIWRGHVWILFVVVDFL